MGRGLSTFVLLVLALTGAPAEAARPAAPLRFDFDSRIAGPYRATVTRVAQEALARVESLVGPLSRAVTVRVLRFSGDLVQATGVTCASACAGPDRINFALDAYLWSRSPQSSDPGHLPEGHLARDMRHELTHAVLMQRYAAVPGWLNEGLAQLVDGTDADSANQKAYQKLYSFEGARPDHIVGLRDLGSLGILRETSYDVALSLCRYLRDEHGADAPARLLDAMAAGATQDEALEAVTGRGQRRFLAEWEQWLYDRVLRPRSSPAAR